MIAECQYPQANFTGDYYENTSLVDYDTSLVDKYEFLYGRTRFSGAVTCCF